MLEYIFHNTRQRNREDVVLLHGIGGSSRIFHKQVDAYMKEYNVISLHLPGHGTSPKTTSYKNTFNFTLVASEVHKTLQHININQAHFVGISLGSIIINKLMNHYPSIVKSAVMGGSITRFSPLSKLLLNTGNLIKHITPYIWLYHLFAYIMMPKSNHKVSRTMFIKEAKKMRREDFLQWYKNFLDFHNKPVQCFGKKARIIPKLYISGKEDHLFVKLLKRDLRGVKNTTLEIIKDCGHVCNIEKSEEFNRLSLAFLNKNKTLTEDAS
ncbi:alpha/beta fold hydrolase [Pontibacillus yanchengensis]|uniref:Alpha/beta fold hydrolase n=2 Tax=Pontibacillus yanchengensis TaxID=462910 RepID=A0ACC7VGU7_9BACI|nr:alpha/beta hydrolase [Pontibacillus yanchengensis]MYL33643.1 alpha/beta fold hydrolase [Pontibacillus yanchengensis]MYL54156.1 alpha/beta fold hydrolase [Pontibacillus yanchengensis]